MAPYPNRDQLVIFDADGTPIDAFGHVACRPLGADKALRATSGAGS